jgi:hypothetical protein
MALLRRKTETPVGTLEMRLASLVGRRAELDAKLTDAAGVLATVLDQRRQSLLDSDLSDEVASARRDTQCRDAADRHSSLVDALSAIGGQIATVEAELIAARDHAARQEHVRKIRAVIAPLVAARDELIPILRKMTGTVNAVVAVVPVDVNFGPQLNGIVETIIPAALSELIEAAERHAGNVEAGSEQPRRDPVAQPAPEPPAPVACTRAYTLAPLCWVIRGQTMTAPRYAWADIPSRLFAAAVDASLISPVDSDRTRSLVAAFGVTSGPGPVDGIDLDALAQPAAEQAATGLPRSVPRFAPAGVISEHIGKPRQMLVDVHRT